MAEMLTVVWYFLLDHMLLLNLAFSCMAKFSIGSIHLTKLVHFFICLLVSFICHWTIIIWNIAVFSAHLVKPVLHQHHLHSLQIRRANCKNCVIWSKSDSIGRDVINLSKDVVVNCSAFSMKNTITHITLVIHGYNQHCNVPQTCNLSVAGWLYCYGWLVNWQKNRVSKD